jgi:hypothetical protein
VALASGTTKPPRVNGAADSRMAAGSVSLISLNTGFTFALGMTLADLSGETGPNARFFQLSILFVHFPDRTDYDLFEGSAR